MNALVGQFGAGVIDAFRMGQEDRRQRDRRNALATILTGGGGPQQGLPQMPNAGNSLVATPEQQAETARLEAMFPNMAGPMSQEAANAENPAWRILAQTDPETFMQLQGQQQAQQQAQQQRQQADMQTMRRLLEHAATGPEGWQQALSAAQSMGIDLSGIPQQYDPQWVQQQLFIAEAMSDPQTATSVVNDVAAMGIDPASPEGMAAIRELTLYKYGKQTTDEQGRPSLSLPTITLPDQAAPQDAGQDAPQWGYGQTFTFDQFRANVAAMGQAEALANMERSGMAVQIADDAQYNSLPSGTTFRAPDGTIRRKP